MQSALAAIWLEFVLCAHSLHAIKCRTNKINYFRQQIYADYVWSNFSWVRYVNMWAVCSYVEISARFNSLKWALFFPASTIRCLRAGMPHTCTERKKKSRRRAAVTIDESQRKWYFSWLQKVQNDKRNTHFESFVSCVVGIWHAKCCLSTKQINRVLG